MKPQKPKVKKEATPYKILHCPLFQHQKHSHACIVLRAKRVCRINCADFFEWANQNEETIKEVIGKHETVIRSHLKSYDLDSGSNLIGNVMPKGENICEYCGKAFKVKGRLEGHKKKKHKRQLAAKGKD